MLKDHQDAFGHHLYDILKSENTTRPVTGIVERYDGYIDFDSMNYYFSEYKDWMLIEKQAMRYVRGRVLDIGCGAGRHSIYLQEKGHVVLGIDNSPLAIQVCKQRGLKGARVLSLSQINPGLGVFDTVIMMGNNFGLFGSFEGARRLLNKLSRITSKNGRIIASTNDVYNTDNPAHLSYHELNRKRGRMAGQIRLKIRYKQYATPWFDYLMVSKEEMESILDGTDWKINKFIDSDGPMYIAIIEKIKVG